MFVFNGISSELWEKCPSNVHVVYVLANSTSVSPGFGKSHVKVNPPHHNSGVIPHISPLFESMIRAMRAGSSFAGQIVSEME